MPAVARPVVNRLPALLARHGMSWGELGRRTLLPPRLIARLRAPDANPRLAVAERVAAALGVPVEAVWHLARVPRSHADGRHADGRHGDRIHAARRQGDGAR